MSGNNAGLELRKDREENGPSDWLHWLAVLLAVEAFNSADEPLDDWGLANGKGEVSVDVEGTNGGQVGLNGLWLETLVTKMGDPFEDGCLSGR